MYLPTEHAWLIEGPVNRGCTVNGFLSQNQTMLDFWYYLPTMSVVETPCVLLTSLQYIVVEVKCSRTKIRTKTQ